MSGYDSDEAPDDEVEAALAIFEDVIEELTQVAEEREEAREEIAEIVWEIAEALSQSFEDDGSEGSTTTAFGHSRGSLMRMHPADAIVDDLDASASRSASTADDDIDETCLGDIASDDGNANDDGSDERSSETESEERAQRLEVLFLAERDELGDPTMGGTLEDIDAESEEGDIGSVVYRATENPLVPLQRRKSSSQASSVIIKDASPVTDCDTRIFERDEAGSWLPLTARAANYAQTCSPMDKVKTKLAAWSRAGGNGLGDEEAQPRWIRLLPCDDDLPHQSSSSRTSRTEGPLAPPNTERPSGASSTKHSAPQSPLCERDDLDLLAGDVEDDSFLELRVQPSMARPWRERSAEPSEESTEASTQRSLSLPPTPRGGRGARAIHCHLSNLALEDEHFKSHRDSLLLLRNREQEAKTNQQLLEARDSIILTKSKYGAKHAELPMDWHTAWSQPRNLSTINDDSPPRSYSPVTEKPQRNEEDDKDGRHPEEHKSCAICEVERPRWFAAHCKKGAFM